VPILETERLILRHKLAGDTSALVDLWTDPDVTRYLGGPRAPEQLRAGLEESLTDPPPEDDDLWPVIEKATGLLVGHCGLLAKEVDDANEIELVYVFARSAWDKGYATEMGQAIKRWAFENKGIGRLIALIDPENEASQHVAEKLGMHFEKEVLRPGDVLKRIFAVEAHADR
jgi:ribosomal-protein-alanine N-acetyltransferase